MIFIYRTLLFFAAPFISLYLIQRKKTGKEDLNRFSERQGFPSKERAEGKLLWFHAASVGESMSVLTLINKMAKEFREAQILVTTGTVTSAAIMQKLLPKQAVHQYVPIDKTSYVKRFMKHWRPDAGFWVESELWPNLVYESKKFGAKMFLINARISDESYKKWQMFKILSKSLFSCFDLCLAQSERDREKLMHLGAKAVNFIGNLKYDADALYAEPKELARLSHMIGERPVLLAASTHAGEEEIIISCHKQLQNASKNLLTIIAPRHPSRGKILKKLARKNNLITKTRSKNSKITADTEIYIADTIGEMGIFYRLAGTVFMGGSLINHGGQNPLEPARLECAIVTGPYNHNFSEVYENLERSRAALVVRDRLELINTLQKLTSDKTLRQELAHNALEFVKSNLGTAERFIEEIKKQLIEKNETKKYS